MERKYNIGDQFLFVPKKNALSYIDNSEKVTILGSNESRLLCYLIESNHRTIARKELISTLWNARDIYVGDSSLTQSISTLRKALKDSTKHPIFIKTVPKLGYEFIASIKELSESKVKQSQHKKENEALPLLPPKKNARGLIYPQHFVFNTLLLRFEIYVTVLILLLILKITY